MMTEEKADWEIWAGQGFALVVPKADPDKAMLTRVLVLKYSMPDVTAAHAQIVFTRALRGGYLIPDWKFSLESASSSEPGAESRSEAGTEEPGARADPPASPADESDPGVPPS